MALGLDEPCQVGGFAVWLIVDGGFVLINFIVFVSELVKAIRKFEGKYRLLYVMQDFRFCAYQGSSRDNYRCRYVNDSDCNAVRLHSGEFKKKIIFLSFCWLPIGLMIILFFAKKCT